MAALQQEDHAYIIMIFPCTFPIYTSAECGDEPPRRTTSNKDHCLSSISHSQSQADHLPDSPLRTSPYNIHRLQTSLPGDLLLPTTVLEKLAATKNITSVARSSMGYSSHSEHLSRSLSSGISSYLGGEVTTAGALDLDARDCMIAAPRGPRLWLVAPGPS